MARQFALYSLGVLCLTLSALIGFHMGSQSAQAQPPEPIIGFNHDGTTHWVMLSNGDVYYNSHSLQAPPTYTGNFWTGQEPVPTSPTTWSNIKGKYDGKK